MSTPEGAPLRSDPYQELDSAAATAVSDSTRALSPASDRERTEPISKMRRRWQLTSTKAPPTALLPMEDSPGSSGAASSWHMVAPIPAPHFDVESISDGEDPLAENFCSAEGTGFPAPPARSLFRPTPKPKAWQRPPVCLRFNSSFQVDQPESKPLAKPAGSCPRFKAQTRWAPQSPQQRTRVSWSAEATLCRHFPKLRLTQGTPVRLFQSRWHPLCNARLRLLCSIVQVLWAPRRSLSEPRAPRSRRQVFRAPRIFMTI